MKKENLNLEVFKEYCENFITDNYDVMNGYCYFDYLGSLLNDLDYLELFEHLSLSKHYWIILTFNDKFTKLIDMELSYNHWGLDYQLINAETQKLIEVESCEMVNCNQQQFDKLIKDFIQFKCKTEKEKDDFIIKMCLDDSFKECLIQNETTYINTASSYYYDYHYITKDALIEEYRDSLLKDISKIKEDFKYKDYSEEELREAINNL